jgi:hypothetical protein
VKRASEFPAGPVQQIKPWAAAEVFSPHLPYYDFRVGENVQSGGLDGHSMLQSLEQRDVLGYIIVPAANPFGDPDFLAPGILNHDTNTRWPGITVGAAVHMSDQFGHLPPLELTLHQTEFLVKLSFSPGTYSALITAL